VKDTHSKPNLCVCCSPPPVLTAAAASTPPSRNRKHESPSDPLRIDTARENTNP
jgi:hypothetical protein